MIKRTMQEAADFFGMYVVKDKTGRFVWLLEHKPFLHTEGEFEGMWEVSEELNKTILIDGQDTVDFATHDYHVLVVPKELE